MINGGFWAWLTYCASRCIMCPPFGILGTWKGQAWGKTRVLFCRNLVEAQEAKKEWHKAKQWRWKINHGSKGVVVNGSGNGISCITWTQGKKGARSILEKRSSPRCSPSLGKSFMHLLVCVLEFLAHKFQKQPRNFFWVPWCCRILLCNSRIFYFIHVYNALMPKASYHA
jgi:hypothetical protein